MRTQELKARVQFLMNDIKKLKSNISPEGSFSICRKDGKQMDFADIITPRRKFFYLPKRWKANGFC